MIKKFLLISFTLSILSGCAFIQEQTDALFGPKVKPVEIESTNGKATAKTQKRKKAPTNKARSPSQVSENEQVKKEEDGLVVTEEVNDSLSEEDTLNKEGACSYDDATLEDGLRSLAKLAITMFTPRQPNLSMVYYVSSDKAVCSSSALLTTILKEEIGNSDRFNLISSSLEQRIKSQLNQASNAYMIRIAKAQNIDYILTGHVNAQGQGAQILLKITDLKSGSVVWQRTKSVK